MSDCRNEIKRPIPGEKILYTIPLKTCMSDALKLLDDCHYDCSEKLICVRRAGSFCPEFLRNFDTILGIEDGRLCLFRNTL